MIASIVLFAKAPPSPAFFAVVLVVFLVGLVIGLSIFTVILRASLKWFGGIDAEFGHSLGTAFLFVLITMIQQVLFRFAFYGNLPERGEVDFSGLFGFPVVFCFQALFLGARYELSFLKACLVNVGIVLIYIAIFVIVFIFGLGVLAISSN